MTPIINEIVKAAQRGAPVWDKCEAGITKPRDLLRRIADAKAFFLPSFAEDVGRLGSEHPGYTADGAGVFLPAPKTWIDTGAELIDDFLIPARTGFFLEQGGSGGSGLIVMTAPNRRIIVAERFTFGMSPGASEPGFQLTGWCPDLDLEDVGRSLKAALLLINMPVGLKATDEPAHKSNARKMELVAGVRPAVTYRTIKLDPFTGTATRSDDDERGAVQGETHRAFHFCRAYLRTRRSGRTENVRAHWRGDEALGRVETRYVVAPEGAR